jgi:CheY-like chemotaxis protein
VLERLQGDSRTVDIPVVVLSADATTWQRRRFRNAGVYEYLSKPLDLQQLLDVIDQHLGAGAASQVIANAQERMTTS